MNTVSPSDLPPDLRPIYDKMAQISTLLILYKDMHNFSVAQLYDEIEYIVKGSSNQNTEYNVQHLDGLKIKIRREPPST